MRDLERPGRSPVHAPEGMASTSHPLSTQTAVDVLRGGGNALDAAVAACAVQCVVEPESTGIGGDCFCIYAPEGSDDLVAFNGSGRAPAAATANWYAENGIKSIERQSPHSVTVPGAIDAWETLARDHGTRPLSELLQPAIRYARDGYPVSSRVSVDFASQASLLKNDEGAQRVFMPGGKTPGVGEMHRQPELAATMQKIAEGGRDAFYTGDVAEDIVSYLQGKGGLHTMEDFANMRGEYVTPITLNFRGYDVYQCPPNGQGVIALMLLNIMSEVETYGDQPITLERVHAEIEAGRLAYRDRNLYLADPNQAEVPVDWLLSPEHAAQVRAAIDPVKALSPLPEFTGPKHESTVYISVVDKDRNCCSFINTLFSNFGSVQMAPKSGVMLQNRGQGFVLDPNHPNCIAPGKRPLHTIIPGMVVKDGKAVMPYGVMGGEYQSFGHMQFLTGMFDYGLDIQEAQDRPRFFPDPFSGEVEVEGTIPEDIQAGLREKGHKLARPAKPIGGSQAIWVDYEQSVLTAGSDPRKDGCAIGY
ncbi:MAG: gamma-glutamyltransferase [Hyphomicrobiaceae bacterium TMED74]|nr:gamma-glutamyltransferase [Filomicrobium sp.]RPG40592.1 MAG: gamma-glutamyltransferase [Hyphomicrobiaceae bacterium TMED74]